MEPKFNMLKQKTTPPNLAKTTQNIFNKLLRRSSTTHKQLTAQYSQHSAQLLPNKQLPPQKTMTNVKQLLDYISTQEEVIITYRASDMILSVHSNAGYCNNKKAQSQAGGHFYLSNNNPTPPNNGAILTVATIIKNVMSLAAEAELGAVYLNTKETVYL